MGPVARTGDRARERSINTTSDTAQAPGLHALLASRVVRSRGLAGQPNFVRTLHANSLESAGFPAKAAAAATRIDSRAPRAVSFDRARDDSDGLATAYLLAPIPVAPG
jgi:hypothetical protein